MGAMAESPRVTVSISDGIADVRLNRPDKRNALDQAMFDEIVGVGEDLKSNASVRVVVLSGNGESFCAGLDLASLATLGERPSGNAKSLMSQSESGLTHHAQQSAWVWQELPMPVIGAIHGHALGGGIQIALGTDIRIAHPDTKFSVRETFYGIIPDMTGTLSLLSVTSLDKAKELVFTARIFDGREAKELGVVTRLSESPFDDAMVLARQIAAISPDATRAAKNLMNRAMHDQAAAQFELERFHVKRLIGSPNQKESATAYFEKRVPRFVDPD